MQADGDWILDRFSFRLEPREVELLLSIQASIQSALVFWRVFPDLAGVPPERLPGANIPPQGTQSRGYDDTAKQLEEFMVNVIELATTQRLRWPAPSQVAEKKSN